MPYSLFDRAFFGWLASSEQEMRLLLAAFEQLAHDPVGCAHGGGQDQRGRRFYVHEVGRFRIHYHVNRDGLVQIFDILAR